MLPDLMKHVRLPLIPKHYLFEKVLVEPLLKNSPECTDFIYSFLYCKCINYLFNSCIILGQNYITETLNFHLHKNKEFGSFYNTVCIKPRKSHKVSVLDIIVVFNFTIFKFMFTHRLS